MATPTLGPSTLELQLLRRAMNRDRQPQIATIIAMPDREYSVLADPDAMDTARRMLLGAARQAPAASVVVDLARARFLGAELVGILASAAAVLKRRGKRLVLWSSPECLAVLQASGFGSMSNVEVLEATEATSGVQADADVVERLA